jgi:hypothetical protein
MSSKKVDTRFKFAQFFLIFALVYVGSRVVLSAFFPEQFGPESLRDAVEGGRGSCSEMIISRLIDAISDFAGGREQSDDITLVVIRREE